MSLDTVMILIVKTQVMKQKRDATGQVRSLKHPGVGSPQQGVLGATSSILKDCAVFWCHLLGNLI